MVVAFMLPVQAKHTFIRVRLSNAHVHRLSTPPEEPYAIYRILRVVMPAGVAAQLISTADRLGLYQTKRQKCAPGILMT